MPKKELKKIIAEVSEASDAEKKKKVDMSQFLVFDLDGEEYAARLTDLREIIRIPEITPIPNAPEYIQGILNLRGKIIIVVDLEKRFDLTRENKVTPKHVVILEVGKNDFGIIVDSVHEVISVATESIQPSPELVSSKVKADYIDGVVVLDGDEKENVEKKKVEKKEDSESRIIILLNLQKLLKDNKIKNLGTEIRETSKTDK